MALCLFSWLQESLAEPISSPSPLEHWVKVSEPLVRVECQMRTSPPVYTKGWWSQRCYLYLDTPYRLEEDLCWHPIQTGRGSLLTPYTDWKSISADTPYRLEEDLCWHPIQTGRGSLLTPHTDWKRISADTPYRLEEHLCWHPMQTGRASLLTPHTDWKRISADTPYKLEEHLCWHPLQTGRGSLLTPHTDWKRISAELSVMSPLMTQWVKGQKWAALYGTKSVLSEAKKAAA